MSTNWSGLVPVEQSNRGNYGTSVYVQDQTTGVLDLNFLKQLNETTLAVEPSIDDHDITLAAGHGAAIGNTVELADELDSSIFMQALVLNVVGDVLTIDTPVNYTYKVARTKVVISTRNMNVIGSVVSPQIFSIKPLPNQSGDIVRLICTMTDNVDMDFETFGGLPKLTNGVVIRVNNGDGTYRNIANFKSNGDIALYSFDTSYETNKGGGIRGFTARMTWGGQSKHGVVVRVDGSKGESLEAYIQDDLSGLLSMYWIGQGSEIQN